MTRASAETYDVVVLGCGPAGASAGGLLCRRGYRVLGLDKSDFPRYHIGESLTGTVGLHLRAVGLEDEMLGRAFPVKYGVKVIGRNARNEFFVAAAPKPTWQVRRAEFDETLLGWAQAQGMEHRRGTVCRVLAGRGRVRGVRYRSDGEEREARCRFVVDASGLSTYLSREGIAGRRIKDEYSEQIAFFTQIRDCERDPGLMRDNTIIFYSEPHHWAWFIPLTEEVVSVGVVVTRATYRRFRSDAQSRNAEVSREVLEWGLRNINPDLWRRCGEREWTEPVRVIRDYSYAVHPFAGEGWICVGDSHRFIDPIFSFGVSIAIAEASLAADALDEAFASGESKKPFVEYQRRCNVGQDAVSDVIRYFWRFPAFFGVQARGRFREDIMKLFAGACYDERPLPGLVMMRESLGAAVPAAS